jgi:predicted metal-dependent peptidase
MIRNKELKNRYKGGIEWLDLNYAYFVTHVLKIGKPEPTTSIPTAAVGIKLDKDTLEIDHDDFNFWFNPDFLEKLPDDESMAFILAHETMHIVLNHLRLQEDFVDQDWLRKNSGKSWRKQSKDELKKGFEQQRKAKLFNIAADCVINDYLTANGMIINGEMADALCRGKEWIGEDASYMTVTEVYDRIQKQSDDKKKQEEEGGEDGQGQPGQGQPGEGGEPTFTKADGSEGEYNEFDSHDWLLDPDAAEKMADAIDKLNKQLDDETGLPQDLIDKAREEALKNTSAQDQVAAGMKAGTVDSNMESFAQQHGVKLAWAKLLKEVDPEMFKTKGIAPPMIPSFHQRRRKLGANEFRKVNLPVYRKEERRLDKTDEIPSIVLALDVSGSIGPKDADYFVSLAMTIPRERVKVFACTFQTTYQEIDLDNPRFTKGGGTSFDAVTAFIDQRVRPQLKDKYPKAVVVITDGQADIHGQFPDEKEAKSWWWLISPQDRSYGSRAVENIGVKHMLDEYIAG